MGKSYVITESAVAEKTDAMEGIIREVSTKEELSELMERMPYIQTIQAPNGKVRKELYELSMKKYDDVEWVKVIKSVYLRMEDRRYEDFELGYMEKAKQFWRKVSNASTNIPIATTKEATAKIVETISKAVITPPSTLRFGPC